MKPNGKCIARQCESCNFFYEWDMKNDEGLFRLEKKCIFRVLGDEIPRIRGSIDGLQGGVNEARNTSIEAKKRVEDLGCAIAIEMKDINTKLIGS
jgi:hypothetical protein